MGEGVMRGAVGFRWRTWLIVAILVAGALLMIIPYYWMAISSLKPPGELYTYPPRFYVQQPTLDPYRELLGQGGAE